MSLDDLQQCLAIFTVLVIIGVVLEGAEHYREIMAHGWRRYRNKIELIGFTILFIGLAGELYFQARIESADAELKRESDEKIAATNERAERLGKEAELARLEQERIKLAVSWRELSSEQISALRFEFSGNPLSLSVVYPGSDPEIAEYAHQIIEALQAAGCNVGVGGGGIINPPPPEGLSLAWKDANIARRIISAFGAANIHVTSLGTLPVSIGGDTTIYVGHKPRKNGLVLP